MADGEIFINHDHVATFVQDMGQATQRVRQIIDDLQQQLAPKVAHWSGADKDFYHQVQQRWNDEVANLGQILAGHAQVVDENSANYKLTEKQSAEAFAEVRF
ncbi:WXG100 family type VII secretion target [Streptomyces sp. NPDC007856]|uniref:WXG100 family type VII secretion target n=1 Tax=Streptomyces sp. NPDC007856 TaxID=3364781 RepID=UPI0036C3363A